MAYFPMYVDLTNQKCLLVGGGNIAYRKLCILLDFEAITVVIADSFSDEILALAKANSGKITLVNRVFNPKDCDGIVLAIAATNDAEVNESVAFICRQKKIPVNVVDQKELCSFIFPSYIKEQNFVASFSSSGNSPVLTKKIKKQAQDTLITPFVGEINECLGAARPYVKAATEDTVMSKKIYEEIYQKCLEEEAGISQEIIQEIVGKYAL